MYRRTGVYTWAFKRFPQDFPVPPDYDAEIYSYEFEMITYVLDLFASSPYNVFGFVHGKAVLREIMFSRDFPRILNSLDSLQNHNIHVGAGNSVSHAITEFLFKTSLPVNNTIQQDTILYHTDNGYGIIPRDNQPNIANSSGEVINKSNNSNNSITAEATNRAGHCKSLYEQRLLGKY